MRILAFMADQLFCNYRKEVAFNILMKVISILPEHFGHDEQLAKRNK